jgi:uncharacterized protein YerC
MTIAERDIVANYLKKHQELTYQTIADYFQCSVSTIAHVGLCLIKPFCLIINALA